MEIRSYYLQLQYEYQGWLFWDSATCEDELWHHFKNIFKNPRDQKFCNMIYNYTSLRLSDHYLINVYQLTSKIPGKTLE